jgi:hypothetical protein
MKKIYSSGNYIIVEDLDQLMTYEYAKGHTIYTFVDGFFYIKEITQGQYKVAVEELKRGLITEENSQSVYNVKTFTKFLRDNTGM